MGLPFWLFLFQLWGCPASALAAAGNGGRVLQSHPFFGMVDCCLFETLLFPSYATRCHTTFRVYLPRAPALRQVLEAMFAEGALESPSVLVLAFHSSLSSLWKGRLMGKRLVIVSSSLVGCVSITPFRLSSVASVLSQSESWFFLLLWT